MLTEVLMRVLFPQEGQNCLDISAVVLHREKATRFKRMKKERKKKDQVT